MIEQVLMHMPRPITLTERELCVLRVMERALADEDSAADNAGSSGAALPRPARYSCGPACRRDLWTTGLLVLMPATLPIGVYLGAPFPGPSDRFAAARRATIPNGSKRHR